MCVQYLSLFYRLKQIFARMSKKNDFDNHQHHSSKNIHNNNIKNNEHLKCGARNANHHCHHTHSCKHAEIHLKEVESLKNINTHSLNNKQQPEQSQHYYYQPPRTYYQNLLGHLKDKKQRIKQLEEELVRLKTQKDSKDHRKNIEECQERDFEKMYAYMKVQYAEAKSQADELALLCEMFYLESEVEREKNKKLKEDLKSKQTENAHLLECQLENQKLKENKKDATGLLKKLRSAENDVAELRAELQRAQNIKEKNKASESAALESLNKITDELRFITRDRDSFRTKYEEQVRVNHDINDKLKQLKERSRKINEEIVKECQEKVKSADVKFTFSCDQIALLRASEAKLKNKVKELELHILNLEKKPRTAQESKVQKQLKQMYEKSTTENAKLKQSGKKQQDQMKELKTQLMSLQAKYTEEVKELQKVLKLKDMRISELTDNAIHIQQQLVKVKEQEKEIMAKFLKEKSKDITDAGRNTQATTVINTNLGQNTTAVERDMYTSTVIRESEGVDRFQDELIRRLRQQIVDTQAERDTLRNRVVIFEKESRTNNWAQFENLIKENNRRIKDLILEKAKEAETAAHLRVQLEELKAQLQQAKRTPQPYEGQTDAYRRSMQQLQELRNQLGSREFEVMQLKSELQEINHKYSDYYVLKDSNEGLKARVEGLVTMVETLKRSVIHNSYQKEDLILDNHYLTNQLDATNNRILMR